MKKFFAMVLVLMMVLSLSANAFAAEKADGEFVWWYEVYGEQLDYMLANDIMIADWVTNELLPSGVELYVDINAYYSISGPADADYIYDGPNGQRLVSIYDQTQFVNDYSGVKETDWNYMVSGEWFWTNQFDWLIWDWWYDYNPVWLYVWVEAEPDVPALGDPTVLYALSAMISSVAAGAVLTLKKRA